jgi:hypothetical protein
VLEDLWFNTNLSHIEIQISYYPASGTGREVDHSGPYNGRLRMCGASPPLASRFLGVVLEGKDNFTVFREKKKKK